MSNFVLTGHKGLIGSSLLHRLLDEGHHPVALVDLRDGDDIRDINSLKTQDKIDVVYHLASFCKIRECIKYPWKAFEHNSRGTYEVMEFCRKRNVSKVVFTSSTRVLYPEKNPYTASKIYGEELVKSYGINYSIIRPSTVYGPFNDLTRRLTHEFVTRAMKNKDLVIYGDEDKTLDFTYVDDFIEALLNASKHENKTFNVGSGAGTKVCDVAELIINLSGSKSNIIYTDAEKLQPQQVTIKTDFPCETSLQEGMQKTVDFWR